MSCHCTPAGPGSSCCPGRACQAFPDGRVTPGRIARCCGCPHHIARSPKMLHLPRTITTPLSLVVSTGTGEAELDAELRYDPADPFAVSLAIGVECGEPVVWTFARDLLSAG